jgi:hypothetical protein
MNPVRLLTLTGGLSSETRSLVDAMTVKPTSTRMRRIDRVIRGLKQSGVWDKLDVFYMLAAHDEQAGRLNWKNPGTLTATAVNALTFTTDRGFAGDGSTSYLNTGYNAGTGSLGYALNDAHLSAFVLTDSATAGNDLGLIASGAAGLRVKNSAVTCLGRENDTTGGAPSAAVNVPKQIVWTRAEAATKSVYQNGGSAEAVAVVSSAVASSAFSICGGFSFSDRQVAQASIGRSLTAAEVAAQYAYILTYMQGVGAA